MRRRAHGDTLGGTVPRSLVVHIFGHHSIPRLARGVMASTDVKVTVPAAARRLDVDRSDAY